MIVLGIETSCDETAAAVVESGRRIFSSVVASQVDIHHAYGGVVPELASRKHIEAIVPVVQEALDQAGHCLSSINGIAATQGPGLVGSLLVGFSFAKACAYQCNLPWIGVDHLEGHINSVFLEPDPPEFPFVVLLASGGHTSIYHVTGHTRYELLGRTRDDAAGEAYDKVAKMLGLGYPGGRVIDELAAKGDPKRIRFPRPYLDKTAFDFSFSGIKTAVSRYLQNHADTFRGHMADIAASFQEAVVDVLSYKLMHAAAQKNCTHAVIAGGVAANNRLRARVTAAGKRRGVRVHLPAKAFCGDNAAMIAAVGYHHLARGKTAPPDADVYSRMQLPPATPAAYGKR